MTLKQAKFIQKYIENGGNGVQAALAVYSTKSYNTANQIALANLQSRTVTHEIEKTLATRGLTLSEITNKLRVSIDSGHSKNAKNADSIKGIELALKLHGAFPANKSTKAAVSLTEAYNRMSVDELQIELIKTKEQSARLLKDLNEN